jgi:magnesium transporter
VIRAWVVAGGVARQAEPAEAARAAARGEGRAWIDFESESDAAAREILAPLEIHPLVLEDVFGEANRPKVDDYGRYLYVVVHSARWDDDRPRLRELDLIVGEHLLVTYHDGTTRSIAAAHEALPRRPALLGRSPAVLLHFLLDELVDHYLPIIDRIAEEIDDLETHVFEESAGDVHQHIVRLKRGMSALRRIVGPQRDTVLALTRDEFQAIPADLRPYLRDVYDRLARVSDLLDSFRDETATLLELHVSIVSNRLNEVIKRLTVLATIGLPLTVVASWYGMNFDFPEYHWPWPWNALFPLGVLAASAALTGWFLLRRRWY